MFYKRTVGWTLFLGTAVILAAAAFTGTELSLGEDILEGAFFISGAILAS